MKASEARNLTDKACNPSSSRYLKRVYELISKESTKGLSDVELGSPDSLIITSVMNQLRKDGYKVKRYTGRDHTDGYQWDYLNISW